MKSEYTQLRDITNTIIAKLLACGTPNAEVIKSIKSLTAILEFAVGELAKLEVAPKPVKLPIKPIKG